MNKSIIMLGTGKTSQYVMVFTLLIEFQFILNCKVSIKQRKHYELIYFFRFKPTKKNLKIAKVMLEDTGIYICKGTNGFGSEEIRIDLIVIGKT